MKSYIEHMNGGFTFEHTTITKPNYDETMRFEVEPLDYYGDDFIEYLHKGARLLMIDLDAKYGRETRACLNDYVLDYEFEMTDFEQRVIWDLLSRF